MHFLLDTRVDRCAFPVADSLSESRHSILRDLLDSAGVPAAGIEPPPNAPTLF